VRGRGYLHGGDGVEVAAGGGGAADVAGLLVEAEAELRGPGGGCCVARAGGAGRVSADPGRSGTDGS
jgi:hypothetical protein